MKRKNENRGLAPIWMLSLGMALTGSAEIFADPIPCTFASYDTDNNVSDVTFGVLDSGAQPADACYGPVTGMHDANSLFDFDDEGGSWSLLAKWDFDEEKLTTGSIGFDYPDPSDDTGTIKFTLEKPEITTSDTVSYKLIWEYDPSYSPVTLDLNVVTKQGTGYTQYFFDNETLLNESGVSGYGTGEFIINFKCTAANGCFDTDKPTEYSNFAFYGRNPIAKDPSGSEPGVPIPAPLALIGIGGMMLGWMTRKRRA